MVYSWAMHTTPNTTTVIHRYARRELEAFVTQGIKAGRVDAATYSIYKLAGEHRWTLSYTAPTTTA